MTTVLLGAVVLVVGGAFYLRQRDVRSPLRLAQLAPGMSESALRRAVQKSGGAIKCSELDGPYRVCTVTMRDVGADVVAVLDGEDRTIVVRLASDSGTALGGEASLRRGEWSRAAKTMRGEPHVEQGDTGVVRWATADQRWSGEMHFRAVADPDAPSVMVVADAPALAQLASNAYGAATELRRLAVLPPTAEEVAMRQEQQRAANEASWRPVAMALRDLDLLQRTFHEKNGRFAASAFELDMQLEGNVRVNILESSQKGWSAEATHPDFPGRSCVIYGGEVAYAPATKGDQRPTSPNNSVCDG